MQWRAALKALLSRDRPQSYGGALSYPMTQAGEFVDEDRALKYSAVWGCVRVISETIATLPWQVFQRAEKSRKELSNDISWMLQVQPNSEMTPFSFKELMSRRALLCGNAYAEIERDRAGRPVALWPICPDRGRVLRDQDSGRIVYYFQDIDQGYVELDAADVFHVKGPGGDGITGYSIISMAAESIGLGRAMQSFGASFFGNGAHVGGALTHPKTLSPAARKNLEDSIAAQTGRKNALSLRVFEEGMSYTRVGIPPEDAQFLESRQHQVRDICRWYRVPPHKVADLADAKWANIEWQSIDFVTDCIVPWAIRFEQEANTKLFGRNNRGTVYTKLNVAGILRGDQKSRYDAYAVGRQWGFLSVDEIRAFEDMNPLPNGDGDQYLVPSNMTTPELLEKGPQPQPMAPKPPTDDSQDDPIAPKARLNGTKPNGAAHHA